MSTNSSVFNPTVAQLYFDGKQGNESKFTSVPVELVKHCLVDYMDWGDLAKLSTVQSAWKSLTMDAANFGGHEAQWELAEALLNGTHGLEANPAQAIQLLQTISGVTLEEEAITRNEESEPFAPAMKRLAECYLKGNGVENDAVVGVRWLEAAHEVANDVDAAYRLANIYEHGKHDVDIDVFKAAEWYLLAAQGGHLEGMTEYGLCCELGCGREQSDEDALEWYMKAAARGHVTAKYSVGEAFEEARGVPQSDEEACLWYYKAAVEGDVDSKKALKRLHDIARIVVPGVAALLDV